MKKHTIDEYIMRSPTGGKISIRVKERWESPKSYVKLINGNYIRHSVYQGIKRCFPSTLSMNLEDDTIIIRLPEGKGLYKFFTFNLKEKENE